MESLTYGPSSPKIAYELADGTGFMLVPHGTGFMYVTGIGPKSEPAPLSPLFTMQTKETTIPSMRTHRGHFVMTWLADYILSYDGNPILELKCKREQSMVTNGIVAVT